MEWIQLVWNVDHWQAVVRLVMKLGSVTGVGFLANVSFTGRTC